MLLSFRCNDYFVQVLFMSRTTVFYKENQRPTSHTQLKKQLLHKDEHSTWQETLLSMVVKFTFQSVFGNSRRNPRHSSARGREESLELYSILWSYRPTSKQKVVRHGNRFAARFADAIFRKERSDDRKCVCCSQATFIRSVLKIEWAQFVWQNCEKLHSVLGLYDNKTVPHGTVYLRSDV